MKFKAFFLSVWESIRGSYWFVPTSMSVAAVVLSFLMVWLDKTLSERWLQELPWLYTGTAAGARALVATIATAMLNVAGVVFSITIVALTLTSGQFGPRLLRNFMRDRGNQITLGTFLAAFLYCLLILRRIHGGDGNGGDVFVPQLSVLVAVLMALGGVGVLIFFIHHASTSIQAPQVIAGVTRELSHAIEVLYPEKLGRGSDQADASETAARAQIPASFDQEAAAVEARHEGYLQRVEPDQLLAVASAHGLLVRMERRPGHFVQRSDAVLRAWSSEAIEAPVLDALRETFAIGDQRSLAQDAEFAVEQLVEVAVRALSPGINDPFTAMQCVERLGAALSELATRHIPSPYRTDDEGRLRVLAYPKTFSDFLDTAYNQIRQYAAGSLDVLLRMLEAIQQVALHISRKDDRESLAEHARMVYELARAAAGPPRDLGEVERRYAVVQARLAERHQQLQTMPEQPSP